LFIKNINRIFTIKQAVMGVSKKELFTLPQNHVAKIAKALSHPARVAILEYLLKTNACVCGDLVDELPLSQSTISQHLKELKNAGIIHGNISGTSVCYCINPKVWGDAKKMMQDFFKDLDSCC
jgi:DNA-binding transcriptional ArsR family regulator